MIVRIRGLAGMVMLALLFGAAALSFADPDPAVTRADPDRNRVYAKTVNYSGAAVDTFWPGFYFRKATAIRVDQDVAIWFIGDPLDTLLDWQGDPTKSVSNPMAGEPGVNWEPDTLTTTPGEGSTDYGNVPATAICIRWLNSAGRVRLYASGTP